MSDPGLCELRPGYAISSVICGGWQLAGGHGLIDKKAAVENLVASFTARLTTFDCADIYTGVEELIGAARAEISRRHGSAAQVRMKVHTKCVPDLQKLRDVDRAYIRSIVEGSLKRLRMERLDLVQFHWWDYDVPGHLEAARWLEELQREGKIDLLGGTNFDTTHTAELVSAGIDLASMQVQYSLLDSRPQNSLVDFCLGNRISLLCYGTVAGGFMSDSWLGEEEPAPPYENRSLTKYKLIIDEFGGWALFQELLQALRQIADRHATDIASVASRAVLDRPAVGAVIVGARSASHIATNAAIAALPFDAEDRREIDRILAKRHGPQGEPFALERDRAGPHGAIMKYNLNKVA